MPFTTIPDFDFRMTSGFFVMPSMLCRISSSETLASSDLCFSSMSFAMTWDSLSPPRPTDASMDSQSV